jgi:hypothetical protein
MLQFLNTSKLQNCNASMLQCFNPLRLHIFNASLLQLFIALMFKPFSASVLQPFNASMPKYIRLHCFNGFKYINTSVFNSFGIQLTNSSLHFASKASKQHSEGITYIVIVPG